MNEIKIRVWDKREKRMIYPNEAYKEGRRMDYYNDILLMDMNGNISAYTDDDGGKEGLWEHSYDVDVVPMFYIGKKDKSNREIFSGDIVRWINNFGDENIGWVRYTEVVAGFYIVLIKGSSQPFYTGQRRNFEWGELEVIGNIYENDRIL